jgi:CubicO group peptidase (beta-lactamase class C family)
MKTVSNLRFLLAALLSGFPLLLSAAAWQSRHNMTPAAYQQAFEAAYKDGFRVKSISGYTRNGQEYYEALWTKEGSAAWAARHAMTNESYQSNFDDFYGKGYRITALSAFALNGKPRFAAVWERRAGTWAGRHNMDATAYQAAYNDFNGKGYKLRQVCGYVINGKEYFAATWDKDTRGAIIARHNLTARQYQDAFNEFGGKGYVLTCVCGYNKAGIDLFAAIWEQKSGPYGYARHAIPEISYQSVSDNMYYQGYAPVYLNAFASVGGAKYSVIWENTSMKRSDIGFIDAALQQYMKDQSVEGLSLAVGQNGRLVFAKTYGLANKGTGEELGPNHSMRIMSISKPVTACGIMKLWEGDNSILKKRVFGTNGILGSKYTTPSGQSGLNKITVEQLLWHISGLRSCNGEDPFWNKDKKADDAMQALFDAGDLISSDTGSMYIYSNTNYFLLERIIEKLSGQSYESFIRSRILTPAGIGSSMYVGRADGKPGSAECAYDPATEPNMQLWAGFGGWVARPMDLLKFLNRVDGRTPPADQLTAAAHTRMTTGSRIRSNYGFGWAISGTDRQSHNGCHGSSRSFLVELPNGLSYAVIVNTQPSSDDCAWTLKDVVEGALNKVSAWPAYDLF